MITDLQRDYILMGYSIEEARELASHEVAAKQKIQKELEKEKIKEAPVKTVHKYQGLTLTPMPDDLKQQYAAASKAKRARKCTDHEGREHESIAAMAKFWKLPPDVVRQRLTVLHWSKKKSLTTPVQTDFDYEQYIPEFIHPTYILDPLGRKYRTFQVLCTSWRIKPRTVMRRLAKGWGFYKSLAHGNKYLRVIK